MTPTPMTARPPAVRTEPSGEFTTGGGDPAPTSGRARHTDIRDAVSVDGIDRWIGVASPLASRVTLSTRRQEGYIHDPAW